MSDVDAKEYLILSLNLSRGRKVEVAKALVAVSPWKRHSTSQLQTVLGLISPDIMCRLLDWMLSSAGS